MKKSSMYFLAQISVLKNGELAPSVKLNIIHELMNQESLAKFVEEQEEKKNAETME